MKQEKNGRNYPKSELIALAIFILSFCLYILNTFLGKAAIQWGWNVYYMGNLAEFFLLLIASIALIATALHRESAANSKL